ncbi:MAG: sialidase family protein, partial [Limisphaerales bacterium]
MTTGFWVKIPVTNRNLFVSLKVTEKYPMRSNIFRLSLVAGGVLLFSGAAFSQSANLYTFGSDVEITEAPPDDGTSIGFFSSGQHYTAFRGDTVYVVWAESRASTPPTGNHIFFAKSTDKGQTFGPNIRVNSTAAGFNPSMRVDTVGIIYVAYERQGNIFFTKSTDGGNTFIPAVQVVDLAGLPYFQELPSIAVNKKGHVFIAWVDYRTDPQSIFVTASYDSGNIFWPNANVDTALKAKGPPDISSDDNGRVYVVYSEVQPGVQQAVFARSDDSGQSFTFHSNASDLPAGGTGWGGVNPSLAVNGQGLIGVVWEDRRFNFTQFSIRFSASTDYGQTFSPSVRVDDDSDLAGTSSPVAPSLAWRNNAFYVSWVEGRIRPPDPFYTSHTFFSYSVDRGQTFATNTPVVFDSDAFFLMIHPSLSVNEQGGVFVAWLDDRDDPA